MNRVGRILFVIAAAVLASATAWAQSPIVFPPFDAAACVAKPQRLLILDMKSGWWSGDGHEFHDLLLERVVKDCPLIDVEYYFIQHIDGTEIPVPIPGIIPGILGVQGILSFYPQRPGVDNGLGWSEANFPNRPWNEYTQVWLLAGDDEDDTDVPTTHEFFLSLLTKFATPPTTPAQSPGYFIGTGVAHHDHANKVLARLQMPELFQTHLEALDNPSVGDGSGVESLSRVRVGAGLVAHALFDGVESIVDRVMISGQEFDSDFLLTANNPFQVVGRNGRGEPAIAVREAETRRFVIDTGMQRFYSLFSPAETHTYRYLQNIIKYLAR
ncbi:MAG: hypothetical protein ACRD96_26535 [Bryobacteraceae bacterium]